VLARSAKMVIEELQRRTNITRQELARMVRVNPTTLRSRINDRSTPHPRRLKGT
jgi:hypothetical protein